MKNILSKIKSKATRIGVIVFSVCTFQSVYGADFSIDGISYNIVSSVEKTLSVNYASPGSNGYVAIPSKVVYNNETYTVIEIGFSAFLQSSVKEVKLPESITKIGRMAFDGCTGLTKIELSETLISIDEYAFASCSSLEEINFPSTLEYIGPYAFRDCFSLEEISIPNNLVSISEGTFRNCKGLKNIEWGSSINSIETYAFADCESLTAIQLPSSVTTLGESAFYGCTSLTDVKLNNSLTTLPIRTFSSCEQLTNVDLGNTIETIKEYAFWSCSSINEITLPSSLKSIETRAFYSGLEKVTCEALDVPQLATNAFFKSAVNPLPVLYVFEEVLNNYRSSSWNQYFRLITPINDNIYPTEINISPSIPEVMAVGESISFRAEVLPANSIDQTVNWSVYRGLEYISMEVSSEDPNVINVKALQPGQAGIAATVRGEFGWISEYLQITVTENGEPLIEVTSVVLTPSNVEELGLGESITFTATVYPEDATFQTVTWELTEGLDAATFEVWEDNPNMATLTANKVEDLIFGAYIKEQFNWEGEYVLIPVVETSESVVIPVDAIEISGNTTDELTVGEQLQLKALIYPENATYPEVVWTTSNVLVASVSETGLVETLSPGETEITVRSVKYPEVYNSLLIKVNSSINDNVYPTEISISPSVPEVLAVGESISFRAEVIPANSIDQTVNWSVYRGLESVSMEVSSEDPNVIYVMALQPGQAGIAATVRGEFGWISEDLRITVTENGEPLIEVTSVVLTPSNVEELGVGESITFTATVYPEDATFQTVTWELSEGIDAATFEVWEDNPNMATLTANKVEDLIFGAYIKEQFNWAGEYVLIPVVETSESVVIPVDAIEISGNTTDELTVGEQLQLKALIYPENATYPEVVWTSSNVLVASISETGLVEALSPGETEITVRSVKYPEVYDTVFFNVVEKTTGIEWLPADENGNYNVYSSSGLKILSTDNVKELKNLLPGLYIVNGEKIVLK